MLCRLAFTCYGNMHSSTRITAPAAQAAPAEPPAQGEPPEGEKRGKSMYTAWP